MEDLSKIQKMIVALLERAALLARYAAHDCSDPHDAYPLLRIAERSEDIVRESLPLRVDTPAEEHSHKRGFVA